MATDRARRAACHDAPDQGIGVFMSVWISAALSARL
jgi:hypothetical protein